MRRTALRREALAGTRTGTRTRPAGRSAAAVGTHRRLRHPTPPRHARDGARLSATAKTTPSRWSSANSTPGDEYCAQLVAFNASGHRRQREGRVHARRAARQRHPLRGRRQHAAGGSRPGRRGDRIPGPVRADRLGMVLERGRPGRRPPQLGAPTPLGFTDNAFHPVSVHLAGPRRRGRILRRRVCVNESGASVGFQVAVRRAPHGRVAEPRLRARLRWRQR